MPTYRYFITQEAFETFAGADDVEQLRLQRAFERICDYPENPANLVSVDRGREIYGRWFGDWLVLYYIDSPIWTVVIIDCQWT